MESSRGIKEVVWDGKYDAEGKLQRPSPDLLFAQDFPLIEKIASTGNPLGGALFHADNLSVISLLKQIQRKGVPPLVGDGPLKLIYIDPPFDIDRELSGKFSIGDEKVEIACYDDRWGDGKESFAYFMWERLIAMHDLLDQDGSIFVHTNDHSAPLLRALLDDVFGQERFINQIIWHYTGGGRSRSRLSNKHDVILWYSKSERFTFNPDAIRIPYKESSGYAKGGITAASGKHYKPHPDGTVPSDVWEIPMVNPMAKERTGYPTQKPTALLERIIKLASNEGDLIADFFCGSGGLMEAGAKLVRCVLGVDASPVAFVNALSRIGAIVPNYAAWRAQCPTCNQEELYFEGEMQDGKWRVNYIRYDVEEDPSLHLALISINDSEDGSYHWGKRHFVIGDSIPISVENGMAEQSQLYLQAFNYRGEYFRAPLVITDHRIKLFRKR